MRVALATCHPLPEPDPDWEPLSQALERAGVEYGWFAWDDPTAPFEGADVVLIRSTWDYVQRPDAFAAWATRQGARLVNAPALVTWNLHKRYLLELGGAGLAVTPTVLVARGATSDLAGIQADRGWRDVVVKPAISAGSFLTRRCAGTAADAAFFRSVVAERDVLVQPYLSSVDGHGERSLVAIDGEVTHAIRKTPRFTGDSEKVSPGAVLVGDDERAFAGRALAIATQLRGEAPVYARVDVARDEAGAIVLMELELVEPSLFFAQHPPAVDRLVAAIRRRGEKS